MTHRLAERPPARGYRLTPQRQLVLEAVDTLEHATPDDILAEVRTTAGGVNISTVYRTLELLEELGLVSPRPPRPRRSDVPPRRPAPPHPPGLPGLHDVIEADLSRGRRSPRSLRETFGFETDMKHFAIFGRCKDCAAEGSRRAEAAVALES